MPMSKQQIRDTWKRAVKKANIVMSGNFPEARPLTESYWKERLDPLHRPTTELNPLWNQFLTDQSYNGTDFYAWLRQRHPNARQQVHYLTSQERPNYKITFTGKTINFSQAAQEAGMNSYTGEVIYVLDHNDVFYFGVKSLGTFHHSSMLAGAPVSGAGTMKVRNRQIEEVNDHSGHYKPGRKEMVKVARAMQRNGALLSQVNMKISGVNHSEWTGTAEALLQESV